VFVTQSLCVGVPLLFPHCDDKTISLFRSLSSIIRLACPYHLGALLCALLEIKFLSVMYVTDLGMSASCICPTYPVLENGTSSNGMSWPMKIFCAINLQCSGTGKKEHFAFFFFFHWHYSPLWALARLAISFHFFLSVTNSLHHHYIYPAFSFVRLS
jgi:hypothetical protein